MLQLICTLLLIGKHVLPPIIIVLFVGDPSLLITVKMKHEYRLYYYTCVRACMHIAVHVGLLRVLTMIVLLAIPAILLAVHEYSVKLSFCSKVITTAGMSSVVVFLSSLSLSPSFCQKISAGGIPVAEQNSCTLLPGMTTKFCRPAPDTKVPVMLDVVFIVGGSEKG